MTNKILEEKRERLAEILECVKNTTDIDNAYWLGGRAAEDIVWLIGTLETMERIPADIRGSDEGTYYCAGCEERQRKIDDLTARVEELEKENAILKRSIWDYQDIFTEVISDMCQEIDDQANDLEALFGARPQPFGEKHTREKWLHSKLLTPPTKEESEHD